MLKRVFDVVFAVAGIVLLFPIFLIIALLIKFTSGSPILFCQERVGLNGIPFTMHKFRSMIVNSEEHSFKVTASNDSRITKIGRVLRKTKLDELPQLFDVLVGNMSLVGPRPEVSEYVALYPSGVKEIVLSVKPGITDWASISMMDEGSILASSHNPRETYIREIMPHKLAYAIKYVHTRNIFTDIIILIATIGKIFWR